VRIQTKSLQTDTMVVLETVERKGETVNDYDGNIWWEWEYRLPIAREGE